MVPDFYQMVGDRLKNARLEGRLSRREVVEEMNRRGYRISVSSLQDFEEGKRLNLRVFLRLAEVLGRHPVTLLGIGPPDDLSADEIEFLVNRSSKLSDLEKEFLYAGFNHIRRLRDAGDRAHRENPTLLDPTPESVRAAVLRFLASGGAFSVKDLSARSPFSSVPEATLHREVLYLQKAGLLEAVSARPIRYALRAMGAD